MEHAATAADRGRANGVTIAIPVYNEQDRVERAIRSAAPQCERLIVADNASTDGTAAVCERLLAEYPNMEYVRHEHNLGALENWYYLLSVTRSSYFMTLGSHDFIDDDFIATLLPIFEADDAVMLASAGLRYEYDDGDETAGRDIRAFSAWRSGMHDDPVVRLRSFFFDDVNLLWTMYGLFRADAYKDCFTRDLPVYGADVVFLARIARRGKIAITDATTYHAWRRSTRDTRSAYVERMVGQKKGVATRKRMRNEMLAAMFEVLSDTERPPTLVERLRLRFKAMTKFGTFRQRGPDLPFFALYVPVKLARKYRRLARRFRS
ncbi:MAG: glycosyltransferase family 2 protein [Chromatiaceae bacterium]|nr:glycosyltransferase family 2 protein [Chromatiaceae bacterium]MCP5422275.1 glycosyltransferase family 2 protein [Chromatiaceae bacterium]